MQKKDINDKLPIETIPVTFNFARQFGALTIDNVIVSITVLTGTDPDAANMLFGSYQLNGKVVTQIIRNGVPGTKYQIQVDAASGNLKHTLRAILRVVS